MITQKELKERLHYDPDTGIFTYITSPAPRVMVGDSAGCINGNGYKVITINYVLHFAHRLAWLYVHGCLPLDGIDHRNGIRRDNRMCNLRLATTSENAMNQGTNSSNTSGFKGVHRNKRLKKWQAMGTLGGKSCYIGLFKTAEEASVAYQAFAKQHHGEFYSAPTARSS